MTRALRFGWILLLVALIAGCSQKSSDPKAGGNESGAITNYSVRGVVQAVHPEKRSVVIKHEAIPGYMPAMTMPFEVHNTNELVGLEKGASVEFRMRVTEKEGWIDQIRPAAQAPAPDAKPAPIDPTSQGSTNRDTAIRMLPNVPTLNPGDALPDYAFTNHLGARFKLSDLRGSAYAFSFIFTRCPFPNFCPRITDHLTQVQRELKDAANGPKRWRLISITLDPEFDTEAVLTAYGNRAKADPERWWMARCDYDTLDRISGHFGQYYAQGASVAGQNHNLRTVVVDPSGKVHQVFIGNEWTAAELTRSLTEAAAKP